MVIVAKNHRSQYKVNGFSEFGSRWDDPPKLWYVYIVGSQGWVLNKRFKKEYVGCPEDLGPNNSFDSEAEAEQHLNDHLFCNNKLEFI